MELGQAIKIAYTKQPILIKEELKNEDEPRMSKAAAEHLLVNKNWSQLVRIAGEMVETYSHKPCQNDYLQKKKEHCKKKELIHISQGNEFYFK